MENQSKIVLCVDVEAVEIEEKGSSDTDPVARKCLRLKSCIRETPAIKPGMLTRSKQHLAPMQAEELKNERVCLASGTDCRVFRAQGVTSAVTECSLVWTPPINRVHQFSGSFRSAVLQALTVRRRCRLQAAQVVTPQAPRQRHRIPTYGNLRRRAAAAVPLRIERAATPPLVRGRGLRSFRGRSRSFDSARPRGR